MTELQFYAKYFGADLVWVTELALIVEQGLKLGNQYGLNALDALHIAAALLGEADEFITAERSTSPFNRVTELKITFIS